MSDTTNGTDQNHKTAATHRTKMILFSVVVAVIMTIFHIQLANFIFKEPANFWRSGSVSYGTIAHSIIEQNMLSLDQVNPTAFRPPLYPMFIAAFLFVSEQPTPIIIAQSILAGITFGLLTAVAYSYTRTTWPMLLILFLFVAIKFIAFDNVVQHETVLFTTLLCLGAIIFSSEAREHSTKKVIGLGLTLGLAALVRPLAPAVLIVLLLWFGWLILNKTLFTQALKRTLLFAFVFLLILLPWGLRNFISLGTFTVTSTTAGENLWKGNNPATNDIYPELEIDLLETLLTAPPVESGWWDELRMLPQLSEVAQDQLLFNLGKQYILENPLHFLKMSGIKLAALWTPQNIPIFEGDIVWTPTGAKTANLSPYYDDMLPTLLLYLLALPGIWQKRRSPFVLYLIAWSVALSAVHVLTFAESRFRWPINMLMLPMAAVGLHLIVGKIHVAFKQFKISGS